MKVSSIDLGTNTALLLICDIDDKGLITPLVEEQRLPRLGKDVDSRQRINDSAFHKIEEILTEYKSLSIRENVEIISACATSAVRDAINGEEFVRFLKGKTDIDVDILSGEEEAKLTYKGAVSGLSPDVLHPVVLDIGGGSAEISYLTPGKSNGHSELIRHSLQVGSVRLTERFFKHAPPLSSEIQSAREFLREEFAAVRNPGFNNFTIVGTAGTVTTLACLDQNLSQFVMEKVRAYPLLYARVSYWLSKLSTMTIAEILSLSQVTTGRADILTAGVLILHEFMSLYGIERVITSERGLRYGLALRAWEQSRKKR